MTFSIGHVIPYDCMRIIFSYLPAKNRIIAKHNYLIHKIISYLNPKTQMLISKKYYKIVKPTLVLKDKHNFYINIVKKNLDYTLIEYLKNETIHYWFIQKKIYYADFIFKDYISLLKHISIAHNAFKCRLIIDNLIKKSSYKENKHKKKMYKNIIWN